MARLNNRHATNVIRKKAWPLQHTRPFTGSLTHKTSDPELILVFNQRGKKSWLQTATCINGHKKSFDLKIQAFFI